MSFAQYQEEVDFANNYNPADKFAGFDRGDAGRADFDAADVGQRVVGRLTNDAGQRVEIIEDYCDDLSLYFVRVDGDCVTCLLDNRAEAVTVARWWMNGCAA